MGNCKNCGKPITGKRGDAKFCCESCKNEYNYRLRAGLSGTPDKINPLELTMKKVDIPEPEHDPEPEKDEEKASPVYKEPAINVDAAFFRDLIADNIIEVSSDREGEDQEEEDQEEESQHLNSEEDQEELEGTQNNILPEQYITKAVQENNPFFITQEKRLEELLRKKAEMEAEFRKLVADMNHQEGRNGGAFIWTGTLGGVLLSMIGNENPEPQTEGKLTLRGKDGRIIPLPKSKKAKPEKQEDNSLPKLVQTVLFGLLGLGTGLVTKAATEDWREKDKKEKIAVIKKRMEELNNDYKVLLSSISLAKGTLGFIPKQITKMKKEINPAYTKALNGLDEKKAGKQETENKKKTEEPEIKFKSDKILKATDITKMNYKAFNFQGLWREFFGKPSINFKLLIHGNSGEGKSTFTMWMAKYLAHNFGRVLYVSGEEGVNMTFRDKLIATKAEEPKLFVLDVATGDEFMEEVGANEFHFIILDSLHDMEIDAKKLKQIFEKYKNSAFICIDQNNKKGELLGANEKKHMCDIVVNVKDYTAETTKNRFKQKGMSFKTEDFDKSDRLRIIKGRSEDKDNGYNLDSDRKNVF